MTCPSKNVISFYQQHAEEWDINRGRHLFEKQWLERFTQNLPAGGSILDLGCGSGEPIAKHFIDQGYNVTGVDSSEPLLDLCRSRFPTQHWTLSDMRELNLEAKFDGIIAWNSFFHLNHADQEHMFSIFKKHSKLGASLMFTAGPSHGEAINPLFGTPLYHASFTYEEYNAFLTNHGFEIVSYKLEDEDCQGHSIYCAQRNAL